ncbi:hypothetical protein Dimus_008272 [Dionaea muscipula]
MKRTFEAMKSNFSSVQSLQSFMRQLLGSLHCSKSQTLVKNDSFTLVIFFIELLNLKWTTSFIWWQNSLFLCIAEHQLLKMRMAALLMNISSILDLLQRIADSGDEA